MKKNLKSIVMMLFLLSALAGCYPDGADYADEYDIVYTNYDKAYNFTGKKFYAIPDSIVKITGDAVGGGSPQFMKQNYANVILTRMKSNMAARGYTLVTDTALADFFLFPAAMEVTNTYYYYDYYWDYYYGWYYGGYYGGWYYPYPMTTSYTTGTLMMNFVDKNTDNPLGKNDVAWVGIVNGLLEGGDFNNRINKAIDQAFEQSSYLHP